MFGNYLKTMLLPLFRLLLYFIPAKNGPVAITLHHVQLEEFEWLKTTLDLIEDKYEFLKPNDIGQLNLQEKKVLITFDDGYKCHSKIFKECLLPRKISAIFFIPLGFIGLKGNDAQEFADKNFFPDSAMAGLPLEEFDAMTWEEIEELIQGGQLIGGHTNNHPKLNEVSKYELDNEIISSAEYIESRLKIEINQFAYPFGTIDAVNQEAISSCKKKYNFAFSNIRGMLKENNNKFFLFRQNLVPGTPKWLVSAIIDGKLDWLHRKKRFLAEKFSV